MRVATQLTGYKLYGDGNLQFEVCRVVSDDSHDILSPREGTMLISMISQPLVNA